MTRRNRYADTASRLARRYTDRDGRLVTHINGQPTRYRVLETLAAVKYLGCDPTKFPDLLPRLYRLSQDRDGEWRLRIGGAGDHGEHVVGIATVGEAVSLAWEMHRDDLDAA